MIEFLQVNEELEYIWDKVGSSAKFFYHREGWIDFLKKLNYNLEPFVIKKDEEYIGNFFIEYHKRRFTKYGYLPGGISFVRELSTAEEKEIFTAFSEFLKKKVKEKKIWSLRFDYYGALDLDNLDYDISYAAGLPKYSWEIDLTKSIEDIRHEMSSSTRNNINKGERSEIEIKKAETTKEVSEFFNLMKETTRRKGFFNFNMEYFKLQFDDLKGVLSDAHIAYYKDKPIAAAWINYGSDTVFYTHGASTSDRELSKLRSPYLLQWKLINEAKERGFKKYNMWGVLPSYLDNSGADLKGVSDFKKSLGGDYFNSRGLFEVYSGFFPRLITRAYDWWIYRGDRY